ncbi:hypothetical protein RND71_021837 [Anisodus tanguticus]|uniref:Pectin acetylesterase n=1 Tax=Anisodus tanguticus TaxID=243964 RepID=A0AAE1RXA1_9SOLA|nr:hypothetical protein RND71_021837 [Anisodus tanguticus]
MLLQCFKVAALARQKHFGFRNSFRVAALHYGVAAPTVQMVMAKISLQLFCLIICSLAIIKAECAQDLDFYEVKKTIVKNARTILNQDLGKELKIEFYNWNKVLVKYCEGGAFTGDVEYVDHATNLHFRGARIFEAVIEDVLEKGLKNAKNAILAGCSAGGYPTMLYFDRFRSLLSNTPRVKCLVDAGYFIHSKNPKQAKGFEDIFNSLITLHVLTTVEPHLPDLIENGTLTASQKKTLREFRPEFLSTLPKSNNPQLRGVFIDSVNHHTSLLIRWSPENATVINNLSLPKAFADWYFDQKYWYVIDEHDLPIPKSLEHDKQVPQKQRRNGIRRIIFMQEVNVHIRNV